MRFRGVVFALLVCAVAAALFFGVAQAQTPAQSARGQAQGGATTAATQTPANLAQLMRGILFPNSNVIFLVQDQNPESVKPAADPSASTDPLTGTFAGWGAVENSALALAESANLLTIPGRLCSNGRPVPVQNADWAKFVQALREAGMTAYKAAQSKDQKNILEAADTMTTACANCHARYREKPGGVAARCM